jgi:hypothetical protein
MLWQMRKDPGTPQRIFRFLAAWLISAGVAYTVGSVSQSVFVMQELSAAGADLSASVIAKVIFHDLKSLAFGGKYIWYGGNLLVAFLIALPCAILVSRFLKIHLGLVAALAGAVGMVTMIEIINFNSPSTLFAGTRGWGGMLAQVLAGAIGGATFAALFGIQSPSSQTLVDREHD